MSLDCLVPTSTLYNSFKVGCLLLLILVMGRAGEPLALTTPEPRPVVLAPGFEQVNLGPHLEYLEDPSGALRVEDLLPANASPPFQVNEAAVFNAGLVRSPYWFRFRVKNPGPVSQRLVLFLDHEFLEWDLFEQSQQRPPHLLKSKRFLELLQQGATREAILGTSIVVPAESEVTYLMRLNTQFEMKALLSLWTPEARQQQNLRESHFYGWTWGGVFIFAIFFGISYVSLRDRIYLYYAFFLVAFLYFRILERIWVDLFLIRGQGIYELAVFLVFATIMLGLRFAQKLLHLKEAFPRLNQLNNSVVFVILLLLLLLGDLFLRYTLVALVTVLAVPWAWTFGFLSWRKGNELAKYFLAGLGVLLLASMTLPLTALGVLETQTFYRPSIELAALLDCIIFSVALAARFRRAFLERDQAQREAIRNLEENERLRSRFLANVSHELRTPLHGIIGLSETVMKEAQRYGSERAKKHLKLIIRNGQRLNGLVDNLLEVSLGRQSSLTILPEPVALRPLVQEVMGLLESQSGGNTVALHNEVEADLPAVQADRSRLEQVLLNLLNNARVHTHQGTVRVQAHAEEQAVRIDVLDEGAGVPAEDRERIFEAFEQGTAFTPGCETGLGLGLSISREIVEAHGGRIGVEENPRGGSRFWFTLPRSEEPAWDPELTAESASVSQEQEVPQPMSLNPESSLGSVLVVDDEITNLFILMSHFEQAGLNAHFCSSGQEALSLWQQHSFDLILLDVRMPNMDGYEVCEVIRKQASKEELPILFLSALTRGEDITQGIQAGANDYLFKPIVQAELLARVFAYLELKKLRQQEHAPDSTDSLYARKELLARTLQVCLEVWERESSGGMIELAEASGLWGVYYDKTNASWRAPHLRQYLSPSSIPSKPRWRKVAQTLEFLMRRLDPEHPEQSRLLDLHHQILIHFS